MKEEEYHKLEDLELIAIYKQSNDNKPIGYLFQRYAHLILGVCIKYLKNEQDAQDASIMIFEKILKDLQKYEIKEFKSWLYFLCKTFCLMQLRSISSLNRKEKVMQDYFNGFMEMESESHLFDVNHKEKQLTFMEDCMEQLSSDQKLCIQLFYLQEKSYLEVSNETNLTLNNVKSYIQNGKRNLKNCIENRLSKGI